MTTPAFNIGQSVSVAPSKTYRAPQGAYTIVGAMPVGNGNFQYRIKGDLEKFERVIEERYLSASEDQAN